MERVKECLLVGLGGGFGSMLRYMLGLLPVYAVFPVLTLLINVTAALAMGFFTALFGARLGGDWSLLLRAGFCGGFSTLSALSLEVMNLAQAHHMLIAGAYMAGTLALCLIGIWLGEALASMVLAL